MLFKYGGRNVVLILYGEQKCITNPHDLRDSSPSSLYSLVCDVPPVAPVIASAALY